jgi:hypothetical protein
VHAEATERLDIDLIASSNERDQAGHAGVADMPLGDLRRALGQTHRLVYRLTEAIPASS